MAAPGTSSSSGPTGPRADYTRRLEARRAQRAEADRHHLTYGNVRVAAFSAGLGLALVVMLGFVSAWWLLAPAAVFVWASGPLDRAVKDRARLTLAVAFYERALARLDGRWAGTGGETGERFLDDGHLYARDLDLFGEASLFELLSSARTRIGEETLAAWLKNPTEAPVVRARQDAVTELAPRTDLREDLAVLGEAARSGVDAEALAAWGERPPRLASTSIPFWAWPLSVAGVLAVIGLLVWLGAMINVVPLEPTAFAALRAYVATLFLVCGAVAWRGHARATAILRDVSDAAHDLGLLAGVVGRLEAERFVGGRLAELRAELDVEGQPPSRRLAKLNLLMSLVDSRHHLLLRLIGPLLLWDVHLIHAVERWRRTSGPALRRWLAAVGEIEALLSIAGYRYEHPDDVFPELSSEGAPCFDGEGLGHPLIAESEMVRNDVRLAGTPCMLVVSGSNMSGKSTLLRTVGVNAVLAQAGAPVRATRLRMTPLAIGASIQIRDSLQAGVSRFYAEVTRLGLIMDRAGETPVLFLIDELLQGTNSHDRRIGAEAVVRGLVDRGAIGLVTTHDLALAQVADALDTRGANVHFEDTFEDGRLRFDYRLRPGVVQKGNALALMRSVGLDV